MKGTSQAARTALGVAMLASGLAMGGCASAPGPMPTAAPQTPVTQSAVASLQPAIDSIPPTLGAAPTLTLPPVTKRVLPNGLTVLVVEQHELPLADFLLVVGSGNEADPTARAGLASITALLLREGTSTRTSPQIADQLSFLGASLSTGSAWDMSQVGLHTPTAQLDSALALFADVVMHPSFPQKEVERLKKQRLTELLQAKDRARDIADRVFTSVLYGSEHPYGHPPTGTEESTRAITRADAKGFYDSHYRPNNATLIVVGDLTVDDVERRARSLFGNWPRRAVPDTRYPAATAASAVPTVFLVDKPGAPQSSIRIGNIGVPRSTTDYFALQVMNTILGGSFTSRLNQNLREKKGYTYGAASGFSMRRQAGPFTARAEVTGAKTDSALVEFLRELRAIRDTVSDAELTRAKRYLQLGLPSDFETTTDIAFQLVPVVLYGLPADYYATYVQQIERITQSEVQRVARQYVDPSRMSIVIVGDRASIEGGIRAVNVGTISVRDLSGAPLGSPVTP
jgi:predicted Zn-dependent peptidase